MKKFLAALCIAMIAASLVMVDADAARLGGRSSIGRQSSNVSRYQSPPQSPAPTPAPAPQYTRPATPTGAAPAPTRPASPWRGIIGGALAGLGIAALLSHFGLGGAFANIIGTVLVFFLLFFVISMIMRLFRRKPDEPAYAGGYGGGVDDAMRRTPEIGSRLDSGSAMPAAGAAPVGAAAPWGVPADFDTPAFLRQAKTYFIRLQAAWDRADIDDLREFTSPEMFAELRLQIQERGPSPTVTDVVQLDDELLGIETSGRDYLASVKFSGLIKESPGASAEPFAEVWNLSKPVNGNGGWVLAGIQQLS